MNFNTRLPPLEPMNLELPKSHKDADLSFDDQQRSLAGESRFIPIGQGNASILPQR